MKQLFNLFYESYQSNASLYRYDEYKYILRTLQLAPYYPTLPIEEVALEFISNLRESLPEASPVETRDETFREYILRQDILYFFRNVPSYKLTPNADWDEVEEKILTPIRYGRAKKEVLGVELKNVDFVLPITIHNMFDAWYMEKFLPIKKGA